MISDTCYSCSVLNFKHSSLLAEAKVNPLEIPDEVRLKAALPTNQGKPSLLGPGRLEGIDLSRWCPGGPTARARIRSGAHAHARVRAAADVRGSHARPLPADSSRGAEVRQRQGGRGR